MMWSVQEERRNSDENKNTREKFLMSKQSSRQLTLKNYGFDGDPKSIKNASFRLMNARPLINVNVRI